MSEEEIIKEIIFMAKWFPKLNLIKERQTILGLLDLYNKEKEKNASLQKEIDESENYMKDKIRNKIKDLEDNMILFTNDKEKFNRYKYARDILQKLLEEE